MKAERINQDQIRFTLSESDLIERNLKVSELAYGSSKTQALFDDMMQTAKDEFGLDFSEKPMMIEAIPLSESRLSITVTRVRGMAELGAMFGTNIPEKFQEEGEDPFAGGPMEGILGHREDRRAPAEAPKSQREDKESSLDFTIFPQGEAVIYEFRSMDRLLTMVRQIPTSLRLINELWRDEVTGDYYVICLFKRVDPEIRYVVSLLMQFADNWDAGSRQEKLVKEHTKAIIKARALQKLAAVERPE